MEDVVVSVRLPRKDIEAIDAFVDDGEFVNRSDFVRHAVREALEEGREEGALGRIGIPLPAEEGQPRPRRGPRGVKR